MTANAENSPTYPWKLNAAIPHELLRPHSSNFLTWLSSLKSVSNVHGGLLERKLLTTPMPDQFLWAYIYTTISSFSSEHASTLHYTLHSISTRIKEARQSSITSTRRYHPCNHNITHSHRVTTPPHPHCRRRRLSNRPHSCTWENTICRTLSPLLPAMLLSLSHPVLPGYQLWSRASSMVRRTTPKTQHMSRIHHVPPTLA